MVPLSLTPIDSSSNPYRSLKGALKGTPTDPLKEPLKRNPYRSLKGTPTDPLKGAQSPPSCRSGGGRLHAGLRLGDTRGLLGQRFVRDCPF